METGGRGVQIARSEQSAYFVLNVWEEELPGRSEWRGELLHVDSGAVVGFEDWPELVGLIASTLAGTRSVPAAISPGVGAGDKLLLG
jgi:hypothetical protein